MSTRSRHQAVPLRRQRMFKKILESYLDRGRPLAEAEEIAARTVNAHRAKLARGRRGPRLISRGGSRRQWFPGKVGVRGEYACASHNRTFKTKARLRAHYREAHGRTR